MKRKKMLAVALCLALLATLLPGTAFAAGNRAIQLGADGIPGYNARTASYHYVYYGAYGGAPIQWRVLDNQTNKGTTGLFLLSENLLGTGAKGDIKYDTDAVANARQSNPNEWQNSDAQGWCKAFEAGNLTTQELAAILATTKNDGSFRSSTNRNVFAAATGILDGDQVFFLSAEEAENAKYGFTNDASRIAQYNGSDGGWWLRSPDGSNPSSTNAGMINARWGVTNSSTRNSFAARPAFNLDTSKVLFTSAADNSGQNSSFAAPAAYSGTAWKLTLKDGNSFRTGASLTSGNAALTVGYAAETLTFRHAALSSFAGAGYTNVTAALTNAAGELLYYGSVGAGAAATSSEVRLPAGLPAGSYTLSLYAEDRNAANATDYATGTPFTQTITVAAPAAIPKTGDGTPLALLAGLLLLSCAGLAARAKKVRKKKEPAAGM